MLRDADRAFVAAGLADKLLARGEATKLSSVVHAAADQFFDHLARLAGMAMDRVTLSREVWSGELLAAYHGLDSTLEALASYAELHGKQEAIKLAGQRAGQLRDDLARIVDPGKNQVTWVEVRSRSVAVGASPIDLGSLFRDRVFERVGAVVLTSATLTGGGGFKYLRSRMGLDEAARCPSTSSPCPRPSTTRARRCSTRRAICPRSPTPRSRERRRARRRAHRHHRGRRLRPLHLEPIDAGHRRGAAREDAAPAARPGDAPKLMLLRRFRADRNAVLVATMSFWEGVDVPGEALRLVIIDRIPFAVPSDPVVAARSAALEAAGKNPSWPTASPRRRSRSSRGLAG